MKLLTPLILLCYINLFGQINLIPNSSFETGLGVPYCSNPLEKDTTKINECNFGIQISHHFSTSEIKNALKIGLSLEYIKSTFSAGLIFSTNKVQINNRAVFFADYKYKIINRTKTSIFIGAEINYVKFKWFSNDCRSCVPPNYEYYIEEHTPFCIKLFVERKLINHLFLFGNIGGGIDYQKINITSSSGINNTYKDIQVEISSNIGLIIKLF
jgi:hypothetical protein